jgi:hypothetical protein
VATAVWSDLLASADFTTASSIGKLLHDDIDAAISSRLAPAGTLATVTNLTNAPTVGDLTATMKASVTTAVPSAAANATALLDSSGAIDGKSPRQILRYLAAALAGKWTKTGSIVRFFGLDGTTPRLDADLTSATERDVTLDP